MISSRTQNKQVPFSMLVLCGTVDNENGVKRKFHPGIKGPTIVRIPDDVSYKNAYIHALSGRMEYITEERARALAGIPKTKQGEVGLK